MINRETGRGIEIAYEKTPYMVVWTKVDAPYLCIEPWFGTVPTDDWNNDLTTKLGIQTVEKGATYVRTRVITAIEGK
jgi:galactose mutarotase-like enzyme